MRRPLLIIFIVLLFIDLIHINLKSIDVSKDNEIVIVEGLVKGKVEKQKYDQYKIGKFIVNDYGKKKSLQIGQIVKIKGRYKSLDNMKFKDFDYGRYIRSTGYEAIIYVDKCEVINSNYLYISIGKVKKYIKDTLRYLYKDKSDFINSIILGSSEYLSTEEKDMFMRTGTSHIIAISGLHTGLICSMIAFIIRGINNIYKLILLFIIIFLYSIMVGSSPSIVRSLLFTMIMYTAIFLDRKRDGISTLSLIGIFFIINNPYIIYNASFQLSFLATLSIIYFCSYVNDIFKNRLISVTISANILTIPIIYYSFNGIPILSILGNMIIVPCIGIIIYLSIASVAMFRINLYLAKLVAYFNKEVINIIYYFLDKISILSFSYIEVDNPKFYCVVIYYIILFSYMIYKELKTMKEQENELQGYYKECQ
ncbi:ComEC/Rec2 family competence protein [Romboutsia sp. CE17]|uniref:ComEC/Rec2 family competence protein n=1 Tax=Romboutsia sp. CE17 TaxID=2724150 RepID=UPI001442B447|nr:ComEC/Rec2 family competence protein [Romboutsia sp. CE17]QJA07991.1 ComEC/Rec2 family competence protein [Romboutsia sp. CE17]